MSKSKTMPKVGQWVRVQFDDSGARDGIVTAVDAADDIRFLCPFDDGDTSNNGAPIVKFGRMFDAKESGL